MKKASIDERTKYDMAQALAMTNGQSKRSVLLDSKTKVIEALHGLDIAEGLAQTGHLGEARVMYENHIEVLINIINDMKKDTKLSISIGMSQEVLRERTRVALTDAEKIKEQMKLSESPHRDHSSKKVLEMQEATRCHSPEKKILSKPVKSKSVKLILNHSNDLILTSKSDDDHCMQKLKSSHIAKKSNLNYDGNDPFITTIKNDLYVDSSRLTTTWNDIAGLSIAKRSLQEAAILPLLRPDLFLGLRAPPRAILLFGPPGTGKTMLVKAVAHESGCILFSCSAAAMTSKWVGEGEKLIRTLFRMASDVAPSIIFLDEMDSLLGKRQSDRNTEGESSRRFKTEFMIQMDGIAAGTGDNSDVGKKMLLIGSTNTPWDIDDAIMRRFQRRIYVPLPDKDARLGLWKNLLSKSNDTIKISNKDVTELARVTNSFSCSDIASIANDASFGPLRDLGGIDDIKAVKSADVRPIQMKDFTKAISSSKASVSKQLLRRYEEWEAIQSSTGS